MAAGFSGVGGGWRGVPLTARFRALGRGLDALRERLSALVFLSEEGTFPGVSLVRFLGFEEDPQFHVQFGV